MKEIRHAAELHNYLKDNPKAYIRQGSTKSKAKKFAGGYQLIRPGTFPDGYENMAVPDGCFENLLNSKHIKPSGERTWKLS